MWFKSASEVVEKMGAQVGNVVQGTISGVREKAQGISSIVQENVGPSVSKASEELPKTIQAISAGIKEGAGGAKNTIISSWGWIKREVEGRRK